MDIFWFCVIVLAYKIIISLSLNFGTELIKTGEDFFGWLTVIGVGLISIFIEPFLIIAFLKLMVFPLLPIQIVVGYWDIFWIGVVWAIINARTSFKN